MKKMLTSIALTLMTAAATAGTGTGIVTGYIPGNPNGVAIFVFSTSTVSSPLASCNSTQRFAISSNDPKYRDTVAAILEAHATGTPVTALGTGNCTVLNNAEDLSYVCVGTVPC